MKRIHVVATVLAAMLIGTVVYLSPAASRADMAADAASVINARRDLMKQNGKDIKVIVGFVQNGNGTLADVSAAAGSIAADADKIPDLFPKGTSMDDVSDPQTGAKPAIWEKWDEFVNASQTLKTLALAVKAAADQGDAGGVAAGLKELGQNGCGGCHQTFRQKLQ